MNEAQRMAEVEKFKNHFSYINRPGADKLHIADMMATHLDERTEANE